MYVKRCVLVALAALTLMCLPIPLFANGTETLGPPSISIASGSGIVAKGAGLDVTQPGAISLNVPLDATVKQVLLYWSCQGALPLDDGVTVNGIPVTGALIGGPTLFFPVVFSATFRADITGLNLVHPGANLLSVGGLGSPGGCSFEESGAGVLVIYQKPEGFSSIQIRDGNDLAYHAFAPPLDTTVAQTFTFAPAAVARTAHITLLVASVEGHDLAGPRPNVIRVTVGATTTAFVDLLGSNDGPAWDTVTLNANVPAGATSLSVRVFSEDVPPPTGNPASLAWVAGALDLPIPACTQGYWKNHPGAWPVTSLALGGILYTQAQLLTILQTPPKGDASLILAHQLIAAKLNVALGSDPAPIAASILLADTLLAGGPIPQGVRTNTAAGQAMVQVASVLDSYNNGILSCAAND